VDCSVRILQFSFSQRLANEYPYSNGEKGAQQSSLRALYTLFMVAPDHAEQLVEDSLPALRDILEQEDLSLGVYTSAFRLLTEIVKQSPHSTIIKSGIVVYLVRWSRYLYVNLSQPPLIDEYAAFSIA